MQYDVQQGFVLGPLLLFSYIHPSNSHNISFQFYTGDLQ